ncbi:FAD/NAD(P)-binding domain-containing protein [Lentithecium fluviatile CBS 122367]|uniref:FAD/NAD(P)-binding domain-containing protein n=1 Tax=Lentithecium fluviatile CBS 122367 TaxID=1168545 RepID=A0A6G1JB63_9PLEO|nr:FAD/NAD(P)-binding domain-containing protein [Lentithecium fluviatile CBS 122367]
MASIPVPKAEVNGTTNGHAVQEYDVIIVGAGFSGISNLHRLRNDGLKCHVFEAGSDFGGVWYWNRYPGARVDSETPFYQLNIPAVYNTWNFTQRFPDHRELRRYMAHVDTMLNLRPDVSFNARVEGCEWDPATCTWEVEIAGGDGRRARARWLVLCTGLLHRTHLPDWKGVNRFEGVIHHSGAWPEDTSVKGKRVAVIGAGATSVQIVQELGKEAKQLTMLMRRPSYCLPMHQRTWTAEEQAHWRAYYPSLFAAGRDSAVGFPTKRHDVRLQDVDPVTREKYFEEIWSAGGFQFLLRNYNNVMLDKEANAIVYDFWKRKVRERLTDREKQKLIAPEEMPYFFGTKRTPLENDYYDVLNRENVDIVDLNRHPIEEFTARGLKLGGEDGERDFDIIVCATGFDSFTGSLTHMGLKSKDGVDIKDVWKDGVRTYLGMMMHGFPNAFMVYSPQAPTALSNGPTILECQTDLVCDTIQALRKQGARAIEPTREAEDEWKRGMNAMVEHTLYPYTNSWWNTSNVPGKKAENQSYIGGINNYEAQCREKMAGWKGFEVLGQA